MSKCVWPRLGHYFPVPNEIYHLGLKSGEISVYAYLLSIENRKSFKCWPSYKTIGRAVRMSVNTVKKYVSALEDKELILTERTVIHRRRDGKAMNGSLMYTILPISVAVDLYNKRQLEKLDEDRRRIRWQQLNSEDETA